MLEQLKEDGTPLDIPLYSDPSRAAVKALGIYDYAHDIALPAVLVLGDSSEVVWKYVSDSIFDRPTEEAVLEAIRATAKKP